MNDVCSKRFSKCVMSVAKVGDIINSLMYWRSLWHKHFGQDKVDDSGLRGETILTEAIRTVGIQLLDPGSFLNRQEMLLWCRDTAWNVNLCELYMRLQWSCKTQERRCEVRWLRSRLVCLTWRGVYCSWSTQDIDVTCKRMKMGKEKEEEKSLQTLIKPA